MKMRYLIPVLILCLVLSCNSPSFNTPQTETDQTQEEIEEIIDPELQPEEEPEEIAQEPETEYSQPEVDPTRLITTDDFTYLGAFRLPGNEDRPRTFFYGGNAMTINPAGDPDGPGDGFSGSLYISAHDRMPYGDLPDGNQLAEVSIPAPVISSNLEDLPTAAFLQDFSDVFDGQFETFDEIPRQAMLFLDHPLTGPIIHITFGEHFQELDHTGTHAWISPDLSNPTFQGEWFLQDQSLYDVNGYMLEIPESWAEGHISGYRMASGRFRDGGWSGMGPSLFAYTPWQQDGSAPKDAARLENITLLKYLSSSDSETIQQSLRDYQHPDEWEGAAWLQTGTGKQALIFAGTKGTGDHFWYGFLDSDDPTRPCLEAEMIGEFNMCLNADGTPCDESLMKGCDNQLTWRGWWSSKFNAQIIFYDPADLARVAAGELEPWQPQPYSFMDIDDVLFLNPAGIDLETMGSGEQRRFRIGEIAYHPEQQILYVLELFADEARPVVHAWKVD